MFLSEWCEFPLAPCLAGGGGLDDSSHLDVVEITHVPGVLLSLFSSGQAKELSACRYKHFTVTK